MPIYAYHCDSCGLEMELEHGMEEVEEDCPICKSEESLEKMPSLFMSKHFNELPLKRPGALVDEFIRHSKEDLKEHKKESKEDFKK